MKKITRVFSVLFFVSILISVGIKAQGPADARLAGFDEKAAKDEMVRKHIAPSEMGGYMQFLKNNYISSHGGFQPRLDPTIHYKDPKGLKTKPKPTGIIGNCNNVGFEDTTFLNWRADTSTIQGNNTPLPTVWNVGFATNGKNAKENDPKARHTLLTIPALNNNPANGPIVGYDTIAMNTTTGLADIPLVAPLSGHVSCRLGNSNTGSQTERLRYSVVVGPTTTEFNYQYAVVLNYGTSNAHTTVTQPYFQIRLTDSIGTPIGNNCSSYFVTADSAGKDPNFYPMTLQINDPNTGQPGTGYYKKWTNVSIDLTPYMGRTVIVEFITADCSKGGHFGYAYIDATCGALRPITGFCPGDSIALLVAPTGYASYQWYDTLGLPIPAPKGTKDSLLIFKGHPGNVYTVKIISFSGCPTTLVDTLKYSKITAQSTSSTPTCFMGHTGTASVVAAGGVFGYNYSWSPVPGNTATITGLVPGTYTVHISSIRCTTSSTDTIVTLGSLPPRQWLRRTDPICLGDTFKFSPPTGYPTHGWWMPPNFIKGVGIGQNTPNYISQQGIGGAYRDSMRDGNACLQILEDSLYIVKMTTSTTHIPEHCWMDSVASITLHASGGVVPVYSYHWTGPAGFTSNNQTINNLHPGYYYVTTHDVGHSCINHDSLFIVSPPKPKDSLNITTAYCDGDTATTLRFPYASGPYTWYSSGEQFHFNGPAPDTLRISYPDQYPTYTITYFANGCRRHDTLSVRTVPPPPFEPGKTANIFSPNKDAHNDRFYPFPRPKTLFEEETIEYYTERYHIEIYDRWGVLVYNSHDYKEGWDGRYNGQFVAEGTYYWITYYTPRCIAKTTDFINKGFVQVVK
jgi:gliding motility-associated-like protein